MSNEQRASQELIGNGRCEMEDTRKQQVQAISAKTKLISM